MLLPAGADPYHSSPHTTSVGTGYNTGGETLPLSFPMANLYIPWTCCHYVIMGHTMWSQDFILPPHLIFCAEYNRMEWNGIETHFFLMGFFTPNTIVNKQPNKE